MMDDSSLTEPLDSHTMTHIRHTTSTPSTQFCEQYGSAASVRAGLPRVTSCLSVCLSAVWMPSHRLPHSPPSLPSLTPLTHSPPSLTTSPLTCALSSSCPRRRCSRPRLRHRCRPRLHHCHHHPPHHPPPCHQHSWGHTCMYVCGYTTHQAVADQRHSQSHTKCKGGLNSSAQDQL